MFLTVTIPDLSKSAKIKLLKLNSISLGKRRQNIDRDGHIIQ